jgi:hypothetical protein
MWQQNKARQKNGFLTHCGLRGYEIMQSGTVVSARKPQYEQ